MGSGKNDEDLIYQMCGGHGHSGIECKWGIQQTQEKYVSRLHDNAYILTKGKLWEKMHTM